MDGDVYSMTKTEDSTTPYQAVGTSTRRQDAPDKLTGRARFAGDLPVVGLLHARLVLSPYAHARILHIDTSLALAIPGVVAVFTSETLGMAHANSTMRSQAPLAQKEVYWCGHPVAIVIGETEAAAEDGVAAVDVDYEPLPMVVNPIAALAPGAPLARIRSEDEISEIAGGGAHAAVSASDEPEEAETEALSQNVSDKVHMKLGDIEAGLREAD